MTIRVRAGNRYVDRDAGEFILEQIFAPIIVYPFLRALRLV